MQADVLTAEAAKVAVMPGRSETVSKGQAKTGKTYRYTRRIGRCQRQTVPQCRYPSLEVSEGGSIQRC